MANDIFSKASAYRKKHPRTEWQDCIKAVSKPAKKTATKKSAAKKSPVKKQAVGKAPKKSIRVKIVKKGNSVKATIGGVAHDKIGREQKELAHLYTRLEGIKDAMKIRGLEAAAKRVYEREKKQLIALINASKSLISQYKKVL